MKMYSWKGVSFLTLVCVGSVHSDQVCSVVEHREMQADFTNCSRRYTEEHFNTDKGDTCQLVKSVVGKCGELWQRCHTSREVRRMRDLHIEALVRQYGAEGGLDGCDLIQEYRQSGRTLDDSVEDVICSDDKTMDIQTKFQTCSHSTATSVYQTIQDLTSVKIISDKLCKALTTIGTVCVKHLNECFAEDDLRQMRKSHLEEMKTFLLRISQEKVTNIALDNCKVMEYVENEVESIPSDSIEYDDEDQEEVFVPLDNIEYKNERQEQGFVPPEHIEDNDMEQDFATPDIIPEEEATHEENDNKIISIEQEITTIKVPSSSPLMLKGAKSTELIENQSTSTSNTNVVELVESEENKKDVENILSKKAIIDKEYVLIKNTKEAVGESAGDAVDTVSKQKMISPEEGERLQYIGATGGGHRVVSDVAKVAVIVSMVIMMVMGRI